MELTIETLGRGAVMNSHTFLLGQKLRLTARCQTQCSCYTIGKNRFLKSIARDPQLIEEIDKILENDMVSDNFSHLDFVFKQKQNLHPHKTLDQDENQHAQKLCKLLKNTIISFVIKNKESRKVPKLKDILANSIEQKKKEKLVQRNKVTLDKMLFSSDQTQMSEYKYSLLKEVSHKAEKSLKNLGQLLETFDKKYEYLTRPVVPPWQSQMKTMRLKQNLSIQADGNRSQSLYDALSSFMKAKVESEAEIV